MIQTDSQIEIPPSSRPGYRAGLRALRRSKGQCAECPEKSDKYLCKAHSKRNRKFAANRYRRRRDAGLCGFCGEPSVVARCEDCKEGGLSVVTRQILSGLGH